MPSNIEIPNVTTQANRDKATANSGRPVEGHEWDGHEVLPNNRFSIYERVCRAGGVGCMESPDTFLVASNQNANGTYNYTRYEYGQDGRFYTYNSTGRTEVDYRRDYKACVDSFFAHGFCGQFKGFYAEPLSDMPRDAAKTNGYPPNWVWYHGNTFKKGGLHGPATLYQAKSFLIAWDSHDRLDNNTPVAEFLPVAWTLHVPEPEAEADSDTE